MKTGHGVGLAAEYSHYYHLITNAADTIVSSSQSTDRSPRGPIITEDGCDIFAYHLRRYLEDWLEQTGLEHVLVAPGFGGSRARLGVFEVGVEGAQAVEAPWVFGDLVEAWRSGHQRLVGDDGQGGSAVYELEAVRSQESHLLGFALVRSGKRMGEDARADLSRRVSEALMAARRNGIRLFFDEGEEAPIKAKLYDLLDRMPEWLGCDHSAAILLTHDLDAMTLEDRGRGVFNILADRSFRPEQQRIRRVGMEVDAQATETLIADGLRRFRNAPKEHCLRYQRQETGRWQSDEDQQRLRDWHGDLGDEPSQTALLIPLVAHEQGEQGLYGFIQLEWGAQVDVAPVLGEVIEAIGEYVGRWLANSPLFKLSIQKMWLIRSVGQTVEEALIGGVSADALIGAVMELVRGQVDVPSLAFGIHRQRQGEPILDFVHPHGWSHYDDLELAVEVESHQDSSVAALAVRLERPVVLAGGHGKGDDHGFNNHLWVDEEASQLLDERVVAWDGEADVEDLHRLSDYYKAAREESYATLAYPMTYRGETLGVLAVEVERQTDWLWWTGFGGHLLWSMIAREVAMGLYWGRRD